MFDLSLGEYCGPALPRYTLTTPQFKALLVLSRNDLALITIV